MKTLITLPSGRQYDALPEQAANPAWIEATEKLCDALDADPMDEGRIADCVIAQLESEMLPKVDAAWKSINPILRGAMDYESFVAGWKAMREVEELYRKERLLREY